MKEKNVYFNKGDEVILKQNLDNKPLMVVKRVNKITIKSKANGEARTLKGIDCYWFDDNMSYNEASFSSKDLIIKKSYAQKLDY